METAIFLLLKYRYFILAPLSIIEGPIVAIVAGLLVATGKLDLGIVVLLLFVGDFVGDSLLYLLGRWGEGFVRRNGIKVGITEKRIEVVKKYFHENHRKSVFVSKVAHGIGFVGLIVAGILKIPFGRYIRTCLSITLVQTVIMLALGMIFGHAYTVIEKYMNYYAAGVSALVLLVGTIFLINKIKGSRLFTA